MFRRSTPRAPQSGWPEMTPDRWDSPRWLPVRRRPLPVREASHLEAVHLVSPPLCHCDLVLQVGSSLRGRFPQCFGLLELKADVVKPLMPTRKKMKS